MYSHMPSTNPRKRAAPGASSTVQTPQMPQTYNAGSQLPNADFLRWNQNPDTQNFADPTSNNYLNIFGANGLPQTTTGFDHPINTQPHSTQLARRPNINNNRQLVAQRTYDNTGDPWPYGDDTIMDSQNGHGPNGENDDIEALEEKAAVAKRDAQSKRKQIPPFVQKLSSFLDESKNTELIRWSDRGDSFVVLDEDEFAKTLIPELFKHNNYASFVRQLNMYGFHKRVGLSDNSMKASERKNKSPSEYYNPYFKRGHPNLLWLINKPKGGTNKIRKGQPGRGKPEEMVDGESDDDAREIEDFGPNNYPHNATTSRAISVAPESGPLQRREIALVLSDIQKQQGAISQAITRLRKDHNQVYQQAIAFQSLHERHESSINAILTFLATVYNRSLDGQGAENITRMFQAGLNQQGQHQQQGNVVDIGDLGTSQQQQPPGSGSPALRKAQKLLTAGPTDLENSHVSEPSPAASSPRNQYSTPRSGTVEELFESPSDTTTTKTEPQRDMLNLINSANAQTRSDNNAMEFPDMLTHYENANGNSPLTSEQRSNMLNIIASTSSAPGSNNALVSPAPQAPHLAQMAYTQSEIDDLMRLQHQQSDRIANLSTVLQPLSPSGSIPGVQGDSYFNGTDSIDPHNSNLDLDQFLDSGAFYGASSPVNPNFNFDDFGNGVDGNGFGGGESQFDASLDGVTDGNGSGSGSGMGRVLETVASSETASPADEGHGIVDGKGNGISSGNSTGNVNDDLTSNKRRRKA
ncbi:bdeb639e-b901-47fc-bafd-85ef5bae42f9 [Sclerotinia trifoliorum]|uniref:Bdeb639e-b901-47fc-bafd-85ef5bae42f9 n=1 Tax=Sclerotinia trifoliorum TaxID=28548 RepID=A0A8H2ZR90_9HELO|nr:bdeb639e-b901-47fc-bafd-85ef5bae42f9 [Sclerotinia trifoliorum]